MRLKRRPERLEGEMKPTQLRAIIQGFLAKSASSESNFAPTGLDHDDLRFNQGVDDKVVAESFVDFTNRHPCGLGMYRAESSE